MKRTQLKLKLRPNEVEYLFKQHPKLKPESTDPPKEPKGIWELYKETKKRK